MSSRAAHVGARAFWCHPPVHTSPRTLSSSLTPTRPVVDINMRDTPMRLLARAGNVPHEADRKSPQPLLRGVLCALKRSGLPGTSFPAPRLPPLSGKKQNHTTVRGIKAPCRAAPPSYGTRRRIRKHRRASVLQKACMPCMPCMMHSCYVLNPNVPGIWVSCEPKRNRAGRPDRVGNADQ